MQLTERARTLLGFKLLMAAAACVSVNNIHAHVASCRYKRVENSNLYMD